MPPRHDIGKDRALCARERFGAPVPVYASLCGARCRRTLVSGRKIGWWVEMHDEVREFKRERILSEATQLFFERSFQGASIDAIAERLKVTKPFIYTYFSSKYEILEAVYERSVQSLLKGVEEIFAENHPPEVQLRRVVEFYVRQNVENQELTAIYLNEERNLRPESLERFRSEHREFDVKLASLIWRGIEAGVFSVDDPNIASLSISGMVRWVHRWYNPKGKYSIEKISSEIANLALNLVRYSDESAKATQQKDAKIGPKHASVSVVAVGKKRAKARR